MRVGERTGRVSVVHPMPCRSSPCAGAPRVWALTVGAIVASAHSRPNSSLPVIASRRRGDTASHICSVPTEPFATFLPPLLPLSHPPPPLISFALVHTARQPDLGIDCPALLGEFRGELLDRGARGLNAAVDKLDLEETQAAAMPVQERGTSGAAGAPDREEWWAGRGEESVGW